MAQIVNLIVSLLYLDMKSIFELVDFFLSFGVSFLSCIYQVCLQIRYLSLKLLNFLSINLSLVVLLLLIFGWNRFFHSFYFLFSWSFILSFHFGNFLFKSFIFFLQFFIFEGEYILIIKFIATSFMFLLEGCKLLSDSIYLLRISFSDLSL